MNDLVKNSANVLLIDLVKPHVRSFHSLSFGTLATIAPMEAREAHEALGALGPDYPSV